MTTSTIQFRKPVSHDGKDIFALVENCPPLDPNSLYCNLLQASHFSETSIAAESVDTNGHAALVGFISGYRIPQRPQTLFIWQVAVSEAARGKGLALSMLKHLLQRDSAKDIDSLETTITESNQASWRLFQRLANILDADLSDTPYFLQNEHFAGQHDTEVLVRIGPFNINNLNTK